MFSVVVPPLEPLPPTVLVPFMPRPLPPQPPETAATTTTTAPSREYRCVLMCRDTTLVASRFSALGSRRRACSSAGQSSGLIIRWSLVRIQAGPLLASRVHFGPLRSAMGEPA